MSIAQQVLARAASRIGYYAPDDPNPGSEAGRYWADRTGQQWLAGPSDSVWWCMLFVSMCLDECGQIDAIGGFSFNTDYTVNKVRQHPDAYFVSISFSWELSTTPVNVSGAKPTSLLTISSLDVDAGKLKTLEEKLFGKDGSAAPEPKLLLPDDIKAHFAG